MFAWFRERRRRKILQQPFSREWRHLLESKFSHYSGLSDDEKQRLHQHIQLFVVEKRFEGAGGFHLTDEVRIIIAAHAGLLILGCPFDYLKEVRSILVYPSGMVRPRPLLGESHNDGELAIKEMPLDGEAIHGGPVLIAWDSVTGDAVHPAEGLNVIVHEFAHKIDMLTGDADGVPPLKPSAYKTWVEVCGREYRHLVRRTERGLESFFDDYAAEHPAEFFAVAAEYFFEKSKEMKRRRPKLYELFAAFFKQDPAAR